MAIAVLSTSTASGNNSPDPLVITKPSSVAVGDLLLISVDSGRTSIASPTWPTISGFTRRAESQGGTDGVNPRASTTIFTRVADASDVSASNYSIVAGGGGLNGAAMYRISWNGGSANPIVDFATGAKTMLRQTASTLMILSNSNNGANTVSNTSAYSVTSGEANPSWTEVLDVSTTLASGTNDKNRSASAYATTTNTTSVTNFSYTITGGSGNANAPILLIISEPQNVTADVSHLAITPTVEGITATQVTVATDVSHLAIVPAINGIAGKASSDDTQWVNETVNPTTWTNEPL